MSQQVDFGTSCFEKFCADGENAPEQESEFQKYPVIHGSNWPFKYIYVKIGRFGDNYFLKKKFC